MELSTLLPPATGKVDASIDKTRGNFGTFLKLLTSQMKNQNPLSPMDTHEFTGQLVQFSQVEQMMNMSASFADLGRQAAQSNLLQASQLVGRKIALNSNGLKLDAHRAEVKYALDARARGVTVSILDTQGAVVRTLNGPTEAGQQSITWDGKDSRGRLLPDGVYRVKVAALGADGKPRDVVPIGTATVTGVSRSGNDIKVQTDIGEELLSSVVGLL